MTDPPRTPARLPRESLHGPEGVRGAPLLRYPTEVRSVRFRSRPNRFLALVEDPQLGVFEAHVPNPGRLRELLRAGARAHVARAPLSTGSSRGGPLLRRTAWTLVNIEAPTPPLRWVSVDTGLASPLVELALARGFLPPLDSWGTWRREVSWGPHRYDHAIDSAAGGPAPLALLEVKSSNLREGPTALFPDAPTVRGTAHVRGLSGFARRGGRAALLFVVQRDDVRELRPYGAMDPEFARAVEKARSDGVLVLGWTLHVRPDGALWGEELPVRSPRWEAAHDLAGVRAGHATARRGHTRGAPRSEGRQR